MRNVTALGRIFRIIPEWFRNWKRKQKLANEAYDSWDALPGGTAADFREKVLSIAYQLGMDADARWNATARGAEIFNLHSGGIIAFVTYRTTDRGYDVIASFPNRLQAWDEHLFQKEFGEDVNVTILFDRDTT